MRANAKGLAVRRAIAPVFLATFLAVMACNLPIPASPTVEAPRPPADASVTSTAEIQQAGSGAEPTPSPSLESPSQVTLETPSTPSLRVVFTDNGDLWLRDDRQPALQLADFGSVAEVALSHDGSLIAYVLRDPLEGTAELRSVRADGTGDQALLTAANFDALYVLGERIHTTLSQWAFVPGTETLLFNTRGVFEGPGIAKNDDLLAIHARTGERTLLLNPGAGGDFTHSPDNSQLALVRPDSIGFASIDGSNPRAEVLEYPPVMTYSEYFFYPLPVWSSDGSAVLAAIPAEDPFATPSTGTLWWVPSDGSSPSAGPTLAGDLFRPQGSLPIISPDLTYVAYVRETDVSGVLELVVSERAGDEVVAYDVGSVQWMGWAPGEDRFVYSKNGGADLWLGQLGRQPQVLAEGLRLRWVSEDSFLFITGSPGEWRLMKGQIGGSPELIASTRGDFLAYDFAWIGD